MCCMNCSNSSLPIAGSGSVMAPGTTNRAPGGHSISSKPGMDAPAKSRLCEPEDGVGSELSGSSSLWRPSSSSKTSRSACTSAVSDDQKLPARYLDVNSGRGGGGGGLVPSATDHLFGARPPSPSPLPAAEPPGEASDPAQLPVRCCCCCGSACCTCCTCACTPPPAAAAASSP